MKVMCFDDNMLWLRTGPVSVVEATCFLDEFCSSLMHILSLQMQPIWLEGRDAICPYCDGGFVQELYELLRAVSRQRGFSSGMEDFRQMPNILDAVRAVMEQRGSESRTGMRMAGSYTNFDVRMRYGSTPLPYPLGSL
ncbi:unnamed protein product [Sphenostylis stenocarpa]|uniref:Uncharacterized protein n=1 Tax=Sphenostylis stenocarpa TaxID=92480 RepID=A0AA86SME8_9FABA|nr:unnamed protein product [Sphenostylis stenocarpa]